jgi:Ca-activated chloride channel family protein
MRSVALAGLLTIALTLPAAAQGWIDPVRPTPQWGVVKLRTTVDVRVTGRVARVEVEEWFQNRGGAMGESDYLYPLPGEAVFSNFSLYQGDQELRGETMDADRARNIYEEIVRSKRDPALIELAGHGLVRARVFPIAAGETRKITLRYTQVLNRAGDALQFRYAAGARHGPVLIAQVRPQFNRPNIGTPEQAPRVADQAPLTFTLTAENGAEFRDAFSPTHDVRSERTDGRLVVRPRSELNGDFALFLPLARNAIGITVATHKPSQEPGYFMLTLSPSDVRESSVPRDITAVIDVSGSMSGEKMTQARNALRQLLTTLTARDRFRLIAFSNDVRSYRETWAAANETNVREARRWVEELRAEGGTNISGALEEAFRAEVPDSRLGIVVFMTDGLPSVGEQNPERIAQRVERERGAMRVFAFGVGYDVNTLLLERLSAAARGTTQYVQPGENVEHAVATLAAKVQHPVLADLRITDTPAQITDVYPRQLPDVFAGEELVLFGRYTAARMLEGDVVITGRRAGQAERYSTRASFPSHENGNDFIPRLWASRKIGSLAQTLKLEGHNPTIINEIRETALRYGLLSDYTSYLVQEPTVLTAQQGAIGRTVGTPPPAASNAAAVGASVAGEAAVRSAERARMNREARSTADIEQAQKAFADASRDEGVRRDGSSRSVAGRHFRKDGEVWKDVAHTNTLRVVTIEPFSAAYFALLRRLPELEPYFKEMPDVLVAGKRVSIQVSSGGLKTMADAELLRITGEFRTR